MRETFRNAPQISEVIGMNRKQWKDAIRQASRAAEERKGHPGPGPWPFLLAGTVGFALGALASHLLDPDRGRSRRARYLDQAAAVARDVGRGIGHGSRRVTATIRGKADALTKGRGGDVMPNDAALTDKVETELFGDATVPKGAININVEQGIVVLRGEVPDPGMRERLEHNARKIPGVWEVENLLHLPGEPAPSERPSAEQ